MRLKVCFVSNFIITGMMHVDIEIMRNMIISNFIFTTYKQCLYTLLVNTLTTICWIVSISLNIEYKCKSKFMVIAAAQLTVTKAAVVKH